jgi:hypothetical protein
LGPAIASPETPHPAAGPDARHPGRHASAWRGLRLFWAGVLGALALSGLTLQVLGPPAAAPAAQATRTPPLSGPHPDMAGSGGRMAAGPIAAPDPALLEQMPDDTPSTVASGDTIGAVAPGHTSGALLPRIAADGRTPMQVYAARFDAATKMPRIAIVIAGVGLDQAASEAAIHTLPQAVTLAISPYATAPGPVAAAARQAGDETLVSIPLEPQGYALNDPGQRALLTNAAPADNARRLDWVLSRFTGYVGATGALGDMHGERFAAVPDQMDPMLAELAARGLLYVDPRPGAAPLPYVWSRTVDVVIDEPPDAASIDQRLGQLEKRAHDTGTALGLIDAIRPVTLERLRAWVGNLAGRGYVLAPISAIVTAPPGTASRNSTPGTMPSGGTAPGGTTAVGKPTQ